MESVLYVVAVGVLVVIGFLAFRKGFVKSYRQLRSEAAPAGAIPTPPTAAYSQPRTPGAVQCSECGKPIRKMEGGLFQQVPDMEQWFGNVCVPCGRVFCDSCLDLGGPTPCPRCGVPTKPAQRGYLRQISKAP